MPDATDDLKSGYYLLNTDGGMASNGKRRAGDPLGEAAIAGVLRTRRLAHVAEFSRAIGRASQNVAEYTALIEGLELARRHGIRRLRVYMDSELVVEQMNSRSQVKESRLRELHETASLAAAEFLSIRFAWVPREMNVEADGLVREALAAAR
ncbi:MAG: ribonuclease / adenosylcobalamin/alpha-ribazole phosphatase [Gaiellaceae bacterium]|nr:ribonuclease / adenosylcobalamin/alpha-ribazole phosphatase [Gaiellaceae bacterium]